MANVFQADSRFSEPEFIEPNIEHRYKGDEKSEEEVIGIIKGAYIVNLVGKECFALALKLGIVDNKCVLKVKNVPHAQAILE